MLDDTGSSVIYTVIFILFFFGVAFFINKYLPSRQRFLAKGKYIGVLDRVVLGKEKEIVLIELGEKISMLGVTGESINLICEVHTDELIEKENTEGKAVSLFINVFSKEFNRRENFKNKE